MKANKQLNLLIQLEQEMEQLKDNIRRVEDFVKEGNGYKYHSHVVGELKHRCIALKTTLTRVNRISTSEILK